MGVNYMNTIEKSLLKILQARLHSTWTEKFHIYNLDLEKLEEPEIKLPLIHWIIEKAREIQKSIYFCFSDYTKASDSVVHKNCGKFFKRWEYQTTLPASWGMYMQVKKQQWEQDKEHGTASKLGKEYIKAVYCHPAYLTSVQSTSWEMLGWIKHKLESRLPGVISITSDMQMTPPLRQKVERN